MTSAGAFRHDEGERTIRFGRGIVDDAATAELLEAGGLHVDYHESDAAHHIDPAHVPAAVAWLERTVPALSS